VISFLFFRQASPQPGRLRHQPIATSTPYLTVWVVSAPRARESCREWLTRYTGRACRRGAGVSGVRQTTARHSLTLTREPHCDCGTRFVFERTEADRAPPIPRHPAARPRA
jgi:hypothetical protein